MERKSAKTGNVDVHLGSQMIDLQEESAVIAEAEVQNELAVYLDRRRRAERRPENSTGDILQRPVHRGRRQIQIDIPPERVRADSAVMTQHSFNCDGEPADGRAIPGLDRCRYIRLFWETGPEVMNLGLNDIADGRTGVHQTAQRTADERDVLREGTDAVQSGPDLGECREAGIDGRLSAGNDYGGLDDLEGEVVGIRNGVEGEFRMAWDPDGALPIGKFSRAGAPSDDDESLPR